MSRSKQRKQPHFMKREVGAFQNCRFDRIGLFGLRGNLTLGCLKVGLRYLSKSVLRVSRGTDIGEDTDEYPIDLLSKNEPQ